MTKREAGRIGGRTTFARYGSAGMAARGRLGGRPKLATFDDIRRQSVLAQSKTKGGTDTSGLTELKRAWRTRGSCGIGISNKGPVTPSPAPGGPNQ